MSDEMIKCMTALTTDIVSVSGSDLLVYCQRTISDSFAGSGRANFKLRCAVFKCHFGPSACV